MRCVRLLVVDREHALHHERVLVGDLEHPRHEVDALEHHRPALVERTVDRRADADEHVPRLVEEALQHEVVRLVAGRGEPQPRVEARVVDRRHELVREERAHRLADEVGRRDPRDPEPVGGVGRDGRLARAGGAADEQDDREVELLQLPEAPQPDDRRRALGLAEGLDRQLVEAVEVERLVGRVARSRSACRASSYALSAGTPTAISARAIRPFE